MVIILSLTSGRIRVVKPWGNLAALLFTRDFRVTYVVVRQPLRQICHSCKVDYATDLFLLGQSQLNQLSYVFFTVIEALMLQFFYLGLAEN